MCGIALVGKKHLPDILDNQKDRGLDSLGVLDFSNKTLHHAVKNGLPSYDEFLENKVHIEGDDFALIHHRKASIGDIHLENTHPFVGSKFILCQNGTSKELYAELKEIYNKETDSETLLSLLEEACDTLQDVKDYLNSIEDIIGTVFVVKGDKVLFWTDGTRETYVDVNEYIMKEKTDTTEEETAIYLDGITNYKEGFKYGYSNGGWMIIEHSTGLVLDQWNYDVSWNSSHYTSITFNSTKDKKKTEASKKKDPFGVFSGTHEVSKKNDKKAIEKTNEAGANQMILNGSMKNTINYGMIASALDKDPFTKIVNMYFDNDIMNELNNFGCPVNIDDILNLIKKETHYFNSLNLNSYGIFVKLFKDLLANYGSYPFIYDAADIEVFNEKAITKGYERIDICPFSFTPFSSLSLRKIVSINAKDLFKKLNLVRHMKVLNNIGVDDIILYLDALKYLLYDLTIHQHSGLYKQCSSSPFSLWAYFRLKYGIILSGSPNTLLMSQDISLDKTSLARSFIYASWAIDNNDKDININEGLFQSTINNLNAL